MKIIKFLVLVVVIINIVGCATTSQIQYQMGCGNFISGNINSAISNYEQAIDAEPQNTFYANSLVIAYLTDGQKEKALRLSQKLVEEMPDDGFAYVSLGIANLGYKKYNEAVKLIEKGIEINWKNPKGYADNLKKIAPLWLGIAYMLNEDFKGAENTFKENLQQSFADKAMDYTALTIINYKLSKSEEIFNCIIRIFEMSGWTVESSGKISENPRKLVPKKGNIQNISMVIVLHMYMGEYDKAYELAKTLVQVDEYAGALMCGLVEIGKLKGDEALVNLKIAAKQQPYWLMALWILAMNDAANGDFDGYLKNFYKVITIINRLGLQSQRDTWQEAQQISNTLQISRQLQSYMR